MADLHDAILLATHAHRGQASKDNEPYILHPLRVMMSLKTPEQKMVGMLHDVVEDSDVSLDQLRASGFSEDVIAGVDAMTKRDGEDYMAFAARCKANPIARWVKLADLADNMNLERLPVITAKDIDRLNKYRLARAFLLAE